MLKRFSNFVVNNRLLIVILTVGCILLSLVSMTRLKVNYDLYSYLPPNLNSVKGQKLLTDQFGLSDKIFLILPQLPAAQIEQILENVRKINGVTETFWYSDLEDIKVPVDFATKSAIEKFLTGDETVVQVTVNSKAKPMAEFDQEIRDAAGEESRAVGSYMYSDQIRQMTDSVKTSTLVIAVIAVLVVLLIALVQPAYSVLFMVCTGLSILFNFGLIALWRGEMSFVSSSVSAALQLAVTMDFSIFLLHRYEEEKNLMPHDQAMAHAIAKTTVSISSAALTTVAGFLAMSFMSLRVGMDLGIVMAQGVFVGFVVTTTILPAILLFLEKPLSAIRHRNIIPDLTPLAKRIVANKELLLAVILVIGCAAYIGNANQPLTYAMSDGFKLNQRIQDDFTLVSEKFGSGKSVSVICQNMTALETENLERDLAKIEGVASVSGPSTTGVALIPDGFIPEKILSKMKKEGLTLINVTLEAMPKQLENETFKNIQDMESKYPDKMYATGTDMLSFDIARTANSSMQLVSIATIVSIFLLVLLALRRFVPSIIVVATIQIAIWTNIAILWYMNANPVFFFATISLGAIQLGATVDYSILVSTRFYEELEKAEPKEAMLKTIREAGPSILVSALTLFVATFAISVTSKLTMIKDLGSLLARGSLISGLFVIVFLPALLLIYEQIKRRFHAKH
ncbi:MAG: MMPL family transporter [Caldisericia bacterium]|nr:MMPL family transporter [Caldisericia bacterium]